MAVNDPYDDAGLYDLEYADMVEDLAWYVDRARAARGPVLELGCGTGRLTLPIARAGVPVLGVDRAGAMLDRLREKLAGEAPGVRARVTTRLADWLGAEPPAPVSGILWPFNALHHSPDADAIVQVLQRATGWCTPEARLSLDCYLPDRELYSRDPDERYELRTFTDPRTGEPLESWEQGWWDEQARIHHVIYVYRRRDGTETRTHLKLRMFELDELNAAFRAGGWALERACGDFRGTPLGPRALKWVGVLKKA